MDENRLRELAGLNEAGGRLISTPTFRPKTPESKKAIKDVVTAMDKADSIPDDGEFLKLMKTIQDEAQARFRIRQKKVKV